MATYTVLDLSKYNTVTNYSSIAGAVNGVIIRAGYRGYGSSGTLTTDTKFEAYYAGLNGKTKIGVYWLSQAVNESEAVAEANYLYNLIKNKTIHFPVYLDSEYSNSAHNGRADSLSKSVRTTVTIAFCERMKALGYRAGVYASDSWFGSNLDWKTLSNKGYSLWVAKYSSQSPQVVTKYDGWQYTSSGSCAGVSGGVDLTRFYTDVAGWGGGTPTPPTPSGPVDINSLTLNAPTTQYTYTGSAIQCPFSLLLGTGALTPNKDFTWSYANNVNAGTATCYITGIGNYTGSRSFNYYINAASISSYSLLFDYDATYNGSPHYAYNIRCHSNDFGYLVYDRDFRVGGYEGDVTNVGWVSFYIVGIGNFKDSLWGTYRINAANLNPSRFRLAETNYKYTGSPITPQVITDYSTNDYTVAYTNNVNIGTGICTINGKNNYTGTVNLTFNINTTDISSYNIQLSQYTYTYSPSIKEYKPKVTISGLVENRDFTVTYSNYTLPGTATATVKGINNYSGLKNITYTISRISINKFLIVLSGYQFYYTSQEIKPTVSIQNLQSGNLQEGRDYELLWYNNTDPGTATVVANGINSYEGQLSANFTINYSDIGTCYASYGYETHLSPYIVDNGVFYIFYDRDRSFMLQKDKDYVIINTSRVNKIDHDLLTYRVKGIGGFHNETEFKFDVISQDKEQELYSESVSESISTSISQSESTSISQSESTSISISESISESISTSTSQSIYYSESTSASISNSISESISMSESISEYQSMSTSASISNSISESISISESQSISTIESISESVSLSESASIAYSESVSSSISMSIAISESESTSQFISESISVSESVSVAESMSISTSESISIAISESISTSIYQSESTSISISESTAMSESQSISESISYSVSESESISAYESYSESYSISESESISESVSYSISESYSISVSESISESEWHSDSMEFEDVEIWTYEGDFDFGVYTYHEDTGKITLDVDPDSVAHEDYDYNVASGDSGGGDTPVPEEGYPAGTLFNLDNTPIYTTYTIGSAFDLRTGKYYIYNSAMINGRIRVCSVEDNVNEPAKSSGWCDAMDLYYLGKLTKGDMVSVTGKVYLDISSRQRYIEMESELMYIREVHINENTDTPYALSFEENSAVVGYASASELIKIYQ